jgi:two-component system, NtrC family, sensor kinase
VGIVTEARLEAAGSIRAPALPATPVRRSLQVQLLADLGFLTSSAVLLVGVTTLVLVEADPRETVAPLAALWAGSTVVFVVFGGWLLRRVVVQPLRELSQEADTLATGETSRIATAYESVELDHLARRYRAMAENLLDIQSHVVRVEKLAGIGRLAAGVAHEVRNPLGALSNYVEVLQRRGTDAAVTADMRTAIDRIERTIQSLLDYARPAIATGTTDLNGAVRTTLEFLTAQGLLRNHQIELRLDTNPVLVRGDQHDLEQVVVNLVINACQASPRGRIALGTVPECFERSRRDSRRADDPAPSPRARPWSPRPLPRDLPPGTPGAVLYVADDGPGVAEADRERIFDPFFTTKAPGEGTGLGLAIVARTVHQCGGVVWVDRAREGGAVFKVFLPLASESPCVC